MHAENIKCDTCRQIQYFFLCNKKKIIERKTTKNYCYFFRLHCLSIFISIFPLKYIKPLEFSFSPHLILHKGIQNAKVMTWYENKNFHEYKTNIILEMKWNLNNVWYSGYGYSKTSKKKKNYLIFVSSYEKNKINKKMWLLENYFFKNSKSNQNIKTQKKKQELNFSQCEKKKIIF